MNLKTKKWSKGSFLAKTFLREWERRKARVFGGEEGLLCKSFHLFKVLQEERRKKARASSAKGFKVRTKP